MTICYPLFKVKLGKDYKQEESSKYVFSPSCHIIIWCWDMWAWLGKMNQAGRKKSWYWFLNQCIYVSVSFIRVFTYSIFKNIVKKIFTIVKKYFTITQYWKIALSFTWSYNGLFSLDSRTEDLSCNSVFLLLNYDFRQITYLLLASILWGTLWFMSQGNIKNCIQWSLQKHSQLPH